MTETKIKICKDCKYYNPPETLPAYKYSVCDRELSEHELNVITGNTKINDLLRK